MQTSSHRVPSLALLAAALLALGGCATALPTGPSPSAAAMPAQGKSFDQFRADDASCRQFASGQIGGGSPSEAASQSFLGSAALGTVAGAAAGAAVCAATGNPAAGAAIGAASGLGLGSIAGAGAADYAGSSLQRRYDIGYLQCMSAKGESVPQGLPAYGYGYPTYPSYPAYSYYPYYPYDPYYPRYYYPGWSPTFLSFGFGFHGGGHHHHHR